MFYTYGTNKLQTFEAWNNLAKAYVELGDKPKAWKSLQDAIKCNYDRWQVWDNLMVVSIDLGHFSEVCGYVIKKTSVTKFSLFSMCVYKCFVHSILIFHSRR